MVTCRECSGSGRCRQCYGRGYRGYSVALVEYGASGRGASCGYCAPAGSGSCAHCHGRGQVEGSTYSKAS